MRNLENKHILFQLDEGKSTFSVIAKQAAGHESREMGIAIQGIGKAFQAAFRGTPWEKYLLQAESMDKETPHGPLHMLKLERGFAGQNIKVQIRFALPENYPFLLWKLAVTNLGSIPVSIEKAVLLEQGKPKTGTMKFGTSPIPHDLAFFSNGWQSWSYTAVYGSHEKMRISRLRSVQGQQWYNQSTPMASTPGHFASDFFAVIGDRSTRWGWVVGFLSQKKQFGSITADLRREPMLKVWADAKGVEILPTMTMETDWAYLQPVAIDAPDPLGTYYEAVARENGIRILNPKPTGWCSWYEFYTDIDDDKISRNLSTASRLKDAIPLQLFQIDDGYETQIGDWLTWKRTFKNGLKPHAQGIREAGMIAGLWQAPFIVHRGSDLFRRHPAWMLRNRNGCAVNSGFNWNSFTTALDLTNPEAVDYVCRVTRTAVKEWGYQYLKLDFLYAAALAGRYRDSTRNRAEAIRNGMQSIRNTVGEAVFLLGCGAPLGSMLGIVDGMRIGADVLDKWKTRWMGTDFIFKDEPNTPSACNAIQNVLSRSGMHNRWWYNDPDVLLIRQDSRLTMDEVISLASVIALSGGMLLLSDDLDKVSEERVRIAQKLLPQMDARPWVLDWFDQQMASRLRLDMTGAAGEWSVLSISNWKDVPVDFLLSPRDFKLPDGEYWVRSFWDGALGRFSSQEPIKFTRVPPHATIVLGVREVKRDRFTYLGGDLHISQGLEIESFTQLLHRYDIRFNLGRTAEGVVECYCPRKVKKVKLDGETIDFRSHQEGCIQIPVRFSRSCKVEILL